MQIEPNPSLSVEALRGSIVTNPNGAQFTIRGFEADLTNHEIVVLLADDSGGVAGVRWPDLKDWTIALQSADWDA